MTENHNTKKRKPRRSKIGRVLFDFLHRLQELDHLTSLARNAIARIDKEEALIKAIIKYENIRDRRKTRTVEQRAQLSNLRKFKKYARRETMNGFPLCNAQGAISAWTLLEAMIEDLLCACLEEEGYDHLDRIKKIKVSIVEFEQLSLQEKRLFIIQALEQELNCSLKRGVDRFETLFDVFDLSGPVPKEIKTKLYELANVRNALVHRAGTVDLRLVRACPWLKLKSGSRLNISTALLNSYSHAVAGYATVLIQRLTAKVIMKDHRPQ